MKMLFIGTDLNVFSLFQFGASYELGVEVVQVYTTDEAIEMLEESNEYKAIILLLSGNEPSNLFAYLKEKELKLPILFTGDNNAISNCHRMIKHHPLVSKVSYEKSDKIIIKALQRLLNIFERFEIEKQGYSAIPISFFNSNKVVRADVFIKISEEKYVRVFRVNDTITQEDIAKYVEKDVTHFHLKHHAFLETTSGFMQEVRNKLEPSQMKTSHLNLIARFAHDSACKVIPELGLKDEVITMVGTAISNIKEVVSRQDDIKSLLSNILTGKNYNSEHSLLIVYIVCATVKETEWKSVSNVNKLTLAAFFHDIYVDEAMEPLCMTDDTEQMHKQVPDSMVKKYLNHPFAAVELLKKLNPIPPDVEKIIISHHERPDGSGFPRGSDWKKIFPLAAIFIIAEDFANCVYEGGDDQDYIGDILDEFDQKYNKGNFKKAMEGLRKALALPKLPNANEEKLEKIS